MESTSVLVVGAGPTGLFLSGELARRKIDVKIIEKHGARQEISKALVIQARTLEAMDLCGLVAKFLAKGYPAPGLNIGLHGSAGAAVNLRKLNTRYPYLLVLPQNDTEEILEQRLRDEHVEVTRRCELVSLQQNEGCVESSVRVNGTENTLIRSQYVVGCDGVHSAVRTTAGIPFEGDDIDWTVFLADVKLDANFIRTRITNFTGNRGFVSILPFLEVFARIFAVDFEKQNVPVEEELTLSDLQDTVDSILPKRVTLSEPRWITRFRSPSRQVPRMRDGRILVAGDAAHGHSPAGGQGMNSGLQDAHDLAWRLAAVVTDQSSAELLDEYSEERTTVNREIQRETDQMFRSFVLTNPLLRLGRDLLLRSGLALPAVQKTIGEELSNIGVSYRFSGQSKREIQRERSVSDGIAPGDRMPDADLWAPGEPVLRLYDVLRPTRFHLCLYLSAERLQDDRALIKDLLTEMDRALGATCECIVILDEGLPSEVDVNARVVVDHRGQFAAQTHVSHRNLILIRPDGYVALRVADWQVADVLQRITRWISRR